jgi:hypothetical protein
MSERKNHHITSGLMSIAGHPFFLDQKQEEERLIQNSPRVLEEEQKIKNFLTEPFPDIDDSIVLNFQKRKDNDTVDIFLSNKSSDITKEVSACNGLCVLHGNGCCHFQPSEIGGIQELFI